MKSRIKTLSDESAVSIMYSQFLTVKRSGTYFVVEDVYGGQLSYHLGLKEALLIADCKLQWRQNSKLRNWGCLDYEKSYYNIKQKLYGEDIYD